MIGISTKVVDLDINKRGVVDTELFLRQHDNNVINLEFNIKIDDVEISYSEVNKALMIIYFQNGETLEPILCEVGSDNITFTVNNAMLSKVGTVDGFLRLYSSDNQVLTTNSFRFTVDKDVFENEGIVEDVSLLNQAMEKFIVFEAQEADRVSAENGRNLSETARGSTFSVIQSNYSDIQMDYNDIQSEFNTIKTNFVTIQSDYSTMKSDNTQFKSDISELIVNDMFYKVNTITGSSNNYSDVPIFIVPSGLKYTVVGINIISYGDTVGLTDVNTSILTLEHGVTNISTTTFNDVITFPVSNSIYECVISNADLTSANPLKLSILNSDGVSTPEFTLQINYRISRVV